MSPTFSEFLKTSLWGSNLKKITIERERVEKHFFLSAKFFFLGSVSGYCGYQTE